ncbi:MAG: pyridoxamine 5'-phosphate oxidase family protein [Candidatus Paceibacterota bacterium]
MKLTQKVTDAILSAESKVLATTGPHGVNAVPVSTVFVRDGQIWLVNYFFKKTAENIQSDARVALTCWTGFETAYQIKGEVEYVTAGDEFEEIQDWAAEEFPDRTVSALLKITPEEVHDVLPA